MSVVTVKERENLMSGMRESIEQSGLFSNDALDKFMRMLSQADQLVDIDIITLFLIRDGMKRHSFKVVNGFIRGLPLNKLRIAAE